MIGVAATLVAFLIACGVLTLTAAVSFTLDAIDRRADRRLGRTYVSAGRGPRGGAR